MSKRKSATKKQQDNQTILSIIAFVVIVLMMVTIFQLGAFGQVIDGLFAYLFGSTRYLSYLLIVIFFTVLASRNKFVVSQRAVGFILLQISLIFIFHSILYVTNQAAVENFYTFDDTINYIQTYGIGHFFGGGIIGQFLFEFSATVVSLLGTILLGLIFLYFSILLIFKVNVGEALRTHGSWAMHAVKTVSVFIWDMLTRLFETVKGWIDSLMEKRAESQEEKKVSQDHIVETDEKEPTKKVEKRKRKKRTFNTEPEKEEPSFAIQTGVTDVRDIEIESPQEDDEVIEDSKDEPIDFSSKEDSTKSASNNVASDDVIDGESQDKREIEYESEEIPDMVTEETDSESEKFDKFPMYSAEEMRQLKRYKLPSITLLEDAVATEKVSNDEVLAQGKLLEETLENFGVNAKVNKIRIGPAVTQFEIQPDIGVKVSKIINLQNDIALNLAAKDIRIEAPIPGKSAVGIEVPNSVISMVTLREVLKKRTSSNPLEVALGKDISGTPIMAELNKMPHLLVAGSTGSGKSVCINGIIISILMNAKPHEVKLMMVDPKMVELNVYNGIPHLLAPVVTNPQKASDALNKIVSEMERRYDLFSHTNTRNIEAYNQYLERETDGHKAVQKLPYIVVIIDELADLMMVASKDVEASITRIAQMARAAGIHLIIATQRPSVDVITGIIKANIPSRIAFSVSSQTDSRTIIDGQGAEKLLGRGDMLFLPSGRSKPIRVQGAFLSDNEVNDVVESITSQMKANYEKSIMNQPTETKEVESEDELYPDAKWFVIEEQRASASLLQRQFRIGYNRAARLVDDLEANGVIGPSSGSKPRAVLIQEND